MENRTTGYNLIIDTGDNTFSYDDVGEGKEPVIFIHGFPFDKSMWMPQMEFLKASHRVIAYDINGFGKSVNNDNLGSIVGFAEDLIKLMDVLNISKAIICGLSMGGYIALNAVKRFPGRFSALILADTQCGADTPEAKENRYKTIEQVKNEGISSFGEGFIKKAFCKNTFETKNELVKRITKIVMLNPAKTITGGLTALAERYETCSALDKIHIPTLIICGKEDELTPVEKSEVMHKGIKNSELKIIDEAGHLSNLEQPEEFNRYVGEFLKNRI
ncbi:MAG: alpha/beta hydrolase [Bacteroidota bacterium]